jgi:DNA-binding Lrp family transcriptional regulator
MPAAQPATARAHLLLQVEPGRTAEVARYVADLPAVTEAAQTTGPFDVIAVVGEADDGALASVLARVRRAPGLFAVRVCRRS